MKKNYAYYWRAVNALYEIHQMLCTVVVPMAACLTVSRILVGMGELSKRIQIVV